MYRSRDAFVGGVCAGLAERFDLDPIVVRILFVLFTGMTLGLGAVAYLVLWARLPREPEPDAPYEVTPESAESSAFGCVDCTTGRTVGRKRAIMADGMSLLARLAVAVGLMLLFLAVAVNISPLLPGTEWWQFWPLALLITGLCLIIIPIPTRFETAWHALGIAVTSLAATLLPMSLNVISWGSIPHAFSQAWWVVVAAIVLAAIGLKREGKALVVAGAFLFAAFCLYALTACALPGTMEVLTLHMPDGRSLKISFLER